MTRRIAGLALALVLIAIPAAAVQGTVEAQNHDLAVASSTAIALTGVDANSAVIVACMKHSPSSRTCSASDDGSNTYSVWFESGDCASERCVTFL
jgi:hypothetical protein